MLRRYELTDDEWNRIVDLLPPENTGKQGRPRKNNRTILNGIIWIARSGAPWRDLPERYGPWETVYSRFRKWIDDGILDNIFRLLSLEAAPQELSLDASIVQAHQHSAGAKKGGLPMRLDTAGEVPAQKSMRPQMPMDILCMSCSAKDSAMISITPFLCWSILTQREAMYWQTVGMTVTSCWTISMNVEVSLRFHPERVLNLNGIAIGGSIKKDTWLKNIFSSSRAFAEQPHVMTNWLLPIWASYASRLF